MSDAQLMLVTGSPGSGKSYQMVRKLVEEILPFQREKRIITNIPVIIEPERIEVMDFPPGWLPEGETNDERCEAVRDTWIIIDEAWGVITKDNEKQLCDMVAMARKRGTHWVWMAQSKDDFPKRVQDLARYWMECYNGEDLRDETFGFRIGDIQNVTAKLTGRFCEFFQRQEYRFINRRWTAVQRQPYREWFRQRIGDCYDTKNGQDADEEGRAKVVREYEKLSLASVLLLAARRNAHCIPSLMIKFGVPLGLVGGGLMTAWWLAPKSFGSPQVNKVPTVAERAAVAVMEAKEEATVAKAPVKVKPVVVPRVLTWCLAICGLLAGCKQSSYEVPNVMESMHVARRIPGMDPRVAAFGSGHSLDGLLGEVGLQAKTGMTVDGPLVGREVIDAARAEGFELQGDKLVPGRKRAVPVPSELTVDGASQVGGFPVKLVTEDEVDRWRDLSSVVHEAYSTELLVVAVSSSVTRQVSAIVSGNGTLTVSQPAPAFPFTGKASVALALNGNVVKGRQVCRPVLTSAPGAAATVHVGEKIPVRLASSAVSGGATQTTTIGSTVTYVNTGTQVTVTPSRVSASQVRLSGNVSISEQTASVDNVPATSERLLTVDHLLTLDSWTLLGRLDASRERVTRGWLAIGNLLDAGDDTFLVVARVVQVHRDDRLHTAPAGADLAPAPAASVDLVEKLLPVGPTKPETLQPPKPSHPKAVGPIDRPGEPEKSAVGPKTVVVGPKK